jgi:TRAP-type C4-dicarboxylate transport system permease small subunit
VDDNPISRLCRPLIRAGAVASGYCLLGLSFLVGFEVISRKLFDFSLQGVDEIGGYVLAVVVAFGLSYTLIHRAHTRIDVILGWLPKSFQPVLHFTAFASLAGFAVFMAWRAMVTLGESIEYESIATTPLETPLWIPQSIWVLGLVIFAILSAALALHAGYLLFRCPAAVLDYYGPRTVKDEIKEEYTAPARRTDGGGEPGDPLR